MKANKVVQQRIKFERLMQTKFDKKNTSNYFNKNINP